MDISMKPFVVVVLKTGNNSNNVSERFGIFGPAAQRLQGVKRVAMDAAKEAITVVTEVENLDAVIKMALGYQLRTDVFFKLPGLDDSSSQA